MYALDHLAQDQLLLKSSSGEICARIDLAKGASIQDLTLEGVDLIREHPRFGYADSYASAIMSPFVNRLDAGTYTFAGQRYTLPLNNPKDGAAHHGLVYNQTFRLLDQVLEADHATLVFEHDYSGHLAGYPFPHRLLVDYQFEARQFAVRLTIQNTGTSAMPYSLGWHPYFQVQDRNLTEVSFRSSGKVITNERGVGSGMTSSQEEMTVAPKDGFFDTCWGLEGGEVFFDAPDYRFRMETPKESAFIHIYTPPGLPELIAIEPTTGVSNNFNHGVGLSTLEAGAEQSVKWILSLL